ncbi:hypothetical protein QTP70_002654 [Hemibagrus guttatus]|uniref:ribonuclease H n=1 Tax=Hemibagrus guttatus TaxID=175788 RepID=A0AAE0V2H2_9TELE|nr:hypothetical protein QTP70_002654 [Hemibagrus guttatus]
MEEYIDEVLAFGFIRPLTSAAKAGFFFMEKKDGGLRPCTDFRGLNALTIRYPHPLPLVPTALEQLRGAQVFTKLDLRSTYNLVRNREGDEWKTAFHTTCGHYEYLVMPYGLTNASVVFHSMVNEIFRDSLNQCVIAYIDDILIYSPMLEDHVRHICTVLTRLLQNQLYVTLEKCEFHWTTLTFLGKPRMEKCQKTGPYSMDLSSSPPDPLRDLVGTLRQAPAPAPTSPATTSANTVTASSAPLYVSPMAQPAPYSGSAEDCNGCAAGLFSGPSPSGPRILPVTQSYAGFVEHFKEVFGKPSWDSSVGEELCRLQQGKLTVPEYALQFRTLAAKSGWNEQALLAAYRQGLNPQVRLHIAAYEDAMGLERLIQLSIRVAACMQSCVDEPQDQSSHNTWLDRPATVSSPEPAPEPMHLGTSHLTPAEWQRRLTQNLCLYCGAPGHAIPACPIRLPRPMVSTIFPFLSKMKPLTTHGTLTTTRASVSVVTLLDSGSAVNFISGTLCLQLRLRTKATVTPYQIQSITRKPVSRRQVSCSAGPVLLQVGVLHVEEITLLVLEESTTDVILGHPWLEQHNPILSWRTGKVLKWGDTHFPDCFPDLPTPHSLLLTPLRVQATSIESPFVNQPLEIPTCYAPFSDVFCPKRASKLPPHRPWDCAIDLLPGEPVPRGRIYPLSIPEEKAMEEYIKEALAQGYIRPSTSPAASSFFFVAKKDGGLRPCIDCTLN